ncbi:molybdenum ABC transporter substrate-binding protein [Paenibacillus swuensis]|uniref:Molybdenum ABC transporter substrate-binding protein n=1 Tax=Paenibacillus swuensis TaxID=1178515 RepID=A0A172TL01_9BACL|nr:molybdate ABC transporter substrate-binding protein [Paenibacillus swuensis]ANE47749.1 molybdenum ABC transporter substrate-binding protein [Paenibacillus swuensis]
MLKRNGVLTLAAVLTVVSLYVSTQLAQSTHPKTELIVSAAASLKGSLDQIEKLYEKKHKDINLTFNYGSSGTLQKQIEQGAPVDLFFSAGRKQMDALVKGNLVKQSTNILNNELVMIIPSDSKHTLTTVKQLTNKDIEKVAIGQPESVPAGQYAKEALTVRKVWDPLKDKLIYAKDVRQVLTYVETGNADAGFVYKTDALASKKVKMAIHILSSVHAPISYPAGVLKESKHMTEATTFYNYLQSNEADAVFKKYGFKLR